MFPVTNPQTPLYTDRPTGSNILLAETSAMGEHLIVLLLAKKSYTEALSRTYEMFV
jgi:hypothetical protein